MNHFLISWKYEIISEDGKTRLELFQCDDCIKLELSYQIYKEAIKFKSEDEKLEPALRIISLKDGYADFKNF